VQLKLDPLPLPFASWRIDAGCASCIPFPRFTRSSFFPLVPYPSAFPLTGGVSVRSSRKRPMLLSPSLLALRLFFWLPLMSFLSLLSSFILRLMYPILAQAPFLGDGLFPVLTEGLGGPRLPRADLTFGSSPSSQALESATRFRPCVCGFLSHLRTPYPYTMDTLCFWLPTFNLALGSSLLFPLSPL